jgi:hypothetical protein
VQARNGVGVEHVAAHCPSLLRFQRSNDADFLSFLQWWEARREARHWAGLGGGQGWLYLFNRRRRASGRKRIEHTILGLQLRVNVSEPPGVGWVGPFGELWANSSEPPSSNPLKL